MTKEKENNINKIVSVLVQLDEKSLLLISLFGIVYPVNKGL